MTKVAVDGQKVNIPSLLSYSMEGRRVVPCAHHWICCVVVLRKVSRKIRVPPFQDKTRFAGSPVEMYGSTLPRKASKISMKEPVP
jgi:hypothetical protein